MPELRHVVVVGDESDLELARRQLAPATIRSLGSLRRAIVPTSDLAATAALRRLIRVGRPSVVVTHQSKAAAVTRLATIGLAAAPRVVHSLSMASFGPGYGAVQDRLFRVVERTLGRRTDAFVAVGHDLADRQRSLGLPSERFHVVRSGVDVPASEPPDDGVRRRVRERLGIPGAATVMLFVGSLDQRKGVAELPVLLRDVTAARGGGRTDLVLAGAGPMHDRVTAEARRLGLADRVHLLGHVDDVPSLLWAADVMVLPSRAEGLPQVLVQAAATGLPFAAYDVDGVDELLSMGAHGRVVPIGRVDELATAVAALADAPREGRVVELRDWDPDVIRRGYRDAILPLVTRHPEALAQEPTDAPAAVGPAARR